ncbi:MAG TPA: TetR-like C-terminal domain-containing protein [Streptosporangiaceae bacterium]|nr:TetR-like C-terminal domain-containing protein [Streptosporangiaceae bacterium]
MSSRKPLAPGPVVTCGAFLRAILRLRHEASLAMAAVSGEIATNPKLRRAWHRGLVGMLTGCLRTIVSRAAGRGELPAGSDIELLSQLPLSLPQNRRLEHEQNPGDAVVERIVAQFYTPARPPERQAHRVTAGRRLGGDT